jgi:glyoxylase-like metal-dependent hydrolase (beta-lactamase superfamily II)
VKMSVEQVVPGIYQVSLGMVNAYLLVGEHVTVIDTGIPGSAPNILKAVREVGKAPKDVREILLTHLHADHTGSAKALKEAVAVDGGNAQIYMHRLDAQAFEKGEVMRPVSPAPGLLNWLIVNLFMRRAGPMRIEPAKVDCYVSDDEELPIAGGLKVIHAPGHAAGQVVFLWPQQGGVLFAADACGRMGGRLGYPPIFEDFEVGIQSLRKLAGLTFETAVFGHGGPIRGGAAARFREEWP